MRELEMTEEQRIEKRRQHVRTMGISDEIKLMLREEIEAALKDQPASALSLWREGYETACNNIWRRIRHV